MKLNKYRLGSRLQYNPWTMQEMAYAPQIMREQHDLSTQALLDQEGKLQFEYADVDDKYVSPKIEAIQNKIANTEQKLLNQGYNQGFQQDLINLKKEYMKEAGPQGTLGRAQSNYQAMQEALNQFEKNNPKAPQFFKENAKKAIVANYQGMQDADGNYTPFEPGRVTGYRDVGEDAIEYLKSAGASDQDLSLVRDGKLKITPIKDPYGNTYMQVEQTVPGNFRSNIQQLQSGIDQLQSEWLNPETDRGLSGQLAGYTPEYITGTLSNIGNMLSSNVMSDQPRWSGRLQQVKKPKESDVKGNFTFPSNTSVTYDTKFQKEVNKQLSGMEGAFTNGNFDPKQPKEKGPWHPASIWEDIKESADIVNPAYLMDNPTDKDLKQKEKVNPQQKIWDNVTDEFSGLYDRYTKGKLEVNGKPITNDEDFFNYAMASKQKYAATMNSKTNLVLPNTYDSLNRLIYAPDDNKTFVSLDGDDEMSWSKIKEKYDDADWDIDKMTAWMNSDGNVEVRVPVKKDKVESFVVSGLPQSEMGKQFDKSLQQLETIFKDYTWDSDEIAAQNSPNNAIPLTGSVNNPQPQDLALKVYVDPNDVTNKPMYLLQYKEVTDESGAPTGQYSWVQSNEPVTKSELMQMATFGKASLLDKKFK